MTPYEVVKEIERVTEEYPHGENITPLRKIERLLKSIHGLTSYTDEMVESMQRASDTFYARTDLVCQKSEWELRHELLAALLRLKNAMSMMEAQLPADIG
jgi:hypothetical protein